MRTIAVIVAGYCSFLELYATQPLLPMLADVFHAGTVEVSLTVTLGALGVALAAPMAGRLADRFGKKPVIVTSAFLLAACSLAAATSTTLPVLIGWRFLQGLVTPGVFAVVVAYINDEWAGAGAGATMSAYISGTVGGGFSSRFISGLVASSFDWQWVFVVLGTLNLIGAFVILFILPPQSHALPPKHRDSLWTASIQHFKNRPLVATYAVGFCMLFTQVGVFTYITFYLAAPPFSLATSALGSIFFVYLVGVAMNPLSGKLIDRYGQRTVVTLAIGAIGLGIGLTLIQNLVVILVGLSLCCLGVFAAQTSASGFVGIAARHHRALAVGLYATSYYIGGSVGGVLPGYFWNQGGWPACVAFIISVQLLTLLNVRRFWTLPREAAAVHT